MTDELKNIINCLPDKPGVYQYLNTVEEIIYIGKAKNLKKRVSSYFTKQQTQTKIRVLVKKIADIKHIVVDSEQDALLLENNLIKKYQPKYNALLKDDKSYPWICIKNEPFPRVFFTRKFVRDGSHYFGPYTSVNTVKVILNFIKELYPLRTCNLNLSEKYISQKNYIVCLDYHIGNCLAPCIHEQTEKDYLKNIEEIKDILKGNVSQLIKLMTEKMHKLSKDYKFEEAQKIKEKLKHLENYQSKSTIVSSSIKNVDVFSYIDDQKWVYVNFLKVTNGAITQVHTFEIKKQVEEEKETLLLMAIAESRNRNMSQAKELIVPFLPNFSISNVEFLVPKIGDKKKLLDLSMRNALQFKHEKQKQQINRNPKIRINRILQTIKKDLRLRELPSHIEGFDNSNIQGTNPVAACVVFKNAKPSKKDYRHFKIKTVEGPDDFRSMEEIVYRRYSRLITENEKLPQLIVIDGGKGQLGAALKSLEKLNLIGKVAIIGIAKRLEEIYFPGDSVPIYLDKNSETLKVIQHIRNESHRFGITFHRKLRSKSFISSEIEQIQGIGDKTTHLLLSTFKTIENIKKTTLSELEKVIGKAKAKIITNYFENKKTK